MRTAIYGVAGVFAVVGLCACNGQLPGGGSGATSPFELSVVPGAASQSDTALRINTSTGQAWVSAGSWTFNAIPDPTPIPAGDYHLSTWSTPDGTGKVTWDAYRFERKTGKTWAANCPTPGNCTWNAITP